LNSFENFTALIKSNVTKNIGTVVFIVASSELHEEVGVSPYVIALNDLHITFEKTLFIQVKRYTTVPIMTGDTKVTYHDHGNDVYSIRIRVGFFEKAPNIEKIITDLDKKGIFHDRFYFIGVDHYVANKNTWFFVRWPIKAFLFLYNNSRQSIISNVLPEKILEIGVRIHLPPGEHDFHSISNKPPKGDHDLIDNKKLQSKQEIHVEIKNNISEEPENQKQLSKARSDLFTTSIQPDNKETKN